MSRVAWIVVTAFVLVVIGALLYRRRHRITHETRGPLPPPPGTGI